MARLVKLTRPLLPVMALAIVLGIVGFLAAIFLTVFASWGLLALVGAPDALHADRDLHPSSPSAGSCAAPLRYGEQLCNHYLAFRILALVRDKVFAVLRKLAPAKLEGKDKGKSRLLGHLRHRAARGLLRPYALPPPPSRWSSLSS